MICEGEGWGRGGMLAGYTLGYRVQWSGGCELCILFCVCGVGVGESEFLFVHNTIFLYFLSKVCGYSRLFMFYFQFFVF